MPQTTVEKKFFRARVNNNTQHFTVLSLQKFAVAKFQQIQKNITGGAE